MNPWEKAVRALFGTDDGEEALRDELIQAMGSLTIWSESTFEEYADVLLPVVEGHTRLSVERALTEQSERLIDAIKEESEKYDHGKNDDIASGLLLAALVIKQAKDEVSS